MKGLLSRTFQFFLKFGQFCIKLGQFCIDFVYHHRSMDSIVTVAIVTAIVTLGVALIGYLIATLKHK